VIFGYFVVLPPAIRFLQTFNSSSFDVLVQAKPYYSFVTLTLLSLGILFQIPVGVLALTRAGVITTRQLRRNRRYAIVIIAVLAMLLPGTDPVTTLIEMVPLLVLYELSILLATWLDRATAQRDAKAVAVTDSDETTPDAV
jgi:sec-independent protein translocase protein TatC